jgi:hypothetical protein
MLRVLDASKVTAILIENVPASCGKADIVVGELSVKRVPAEMDGARISRGYVGSCLGVAGFSDRER